MLVRRVVPNACEAVRFGALCYFRPTAPFRSIGGNICMIEAGRRGVRLSFIHGASLPDPDAVLQGAARAKRFVSIQALAETRRDCIRALIRSAYLQACKRR
jgi:hypothetical protein